MYVRSQMKKIAAVMGLLEYQNSKCMHSRVEMHRLHATEPSK